MGLSPQKLGTLLLATLSYLALAAATLALLGLVHLPFWLTLLPLAAFPFALKKQPHLIWLPLASFAALLLWRNSLQPSNNRSWPSDTQQVASTSITANKLWITNYRDFNWLNDPPTETWQKVGFPLDQLSSVDLLIEPLPGSTTFAHAMLTFHFGDRHLCLSIEARREVGEKYGIIPGALNQFELIHIIGSESDLFTLRTHKRGAEIFRFPLKLTLQHQRALLDRFLTSTNELLAKPVFYRSLTHNCTTALIKEGDVILKASGQKPFGLRKESVFTAQLPHVLHQRNLLQLPPDQPLIFENFRVTPPIQ
ncbi:MAG: DUF4105 domain-containing protein [Verrucomicrobiota bacterium]